MPKPKKLTEAQLRVLRMMREGRVIVWTPVCGYFMADQHKGIKAVRTDTFTCLERLGLLEIAGRNESGRRYALTAKGRAAVEGAD